MPRPEKHVFICCQQRAEGHPRGSCSANGAAQVFQAFAISLTQNKMQNTVALTQTGCIGPCHTGVNVLVYPEGIMYAEVNPEEVEGIVQSHFINNEPVVEKFAPADAW